MSLWLNGWKGKGCLSRPINETCTPLFKRAETKVFFQMEIRTLFRKHKTAPEIYFAHLRTLLSLLVLTHCVVSASFPSRRSLRISPELIPAHCSSFKFPLTLCPSLIHCIWVFLKQSSNIFMLLLFVPSFHQVQQVCLPLPAVISYIPVHTNCEGLRGIRAYIPANVCVHFLRN